MKYPKRTVDLEVGDVVCLYGARERVLEVLEVHPERRYTAAMMLMQPLGDGMKRDQPVRTPHQVSYNNNWVQVEMPAGHHLVVVPDGDPDPVAVAIDARNAPGV